MKPLPPIGSGEIRLVVKECPSSVPIGTGFNLIVAVENDSSFVLTSRPPYPVHIAYHWIDETTSETIVWEGKRSGLLPPLGPGCTELYIARIQAPERTGHHILRTTLVQEAVRWLDQIPSMVFADVVIELR